MANPRTPAQRRVARSRWLAAALLLVLLGGGAVWWKAQTWTPSRNDFPVQGVWLSAIDGPIEWPALKSTGADFAYLTATHGAGMRDEGFSAALEEARKQKISVGALHVFDICAAAEEQAANFVTTVPRDADQLPPAVRLDMATANCPSPPGEAAMQSELTTFLNQIERHSGKPALLLATADFEKQYHITAVIDRNVWVEGDYLIPGYARRPWVMWTANRSLHHPAAEQPLQWVVVRP